MRIVLVIGRLSAGGAERQLLQLAQGLGGSGHRVLLVTFFPDEEAFAPAASKACPAAPAFERFPLVSAPHRSRVLRLAQRAAAAARLRRILHRERAQIVYGFLPVPNLVVWAASFGLASVRRIWGVRASDHRTRLWERLVLGLGALLSRRADALVANSRVGLEHHRRRGYGGRLQRVIANGIDVGYFRRDPAAGERQRLAWGVPESGVLIGLVARLHPMKDHAGFLAAAAVLAGRHDDVQFVCVGGGLRAYRQRLEARARELDLGGRIHWIGFQAEMPAVYSALDLAVSSSSGGEGFPNAVAEAMACEVPCVVTDVGDSARVVGETGVVVPPRRPEAFAEGVERLLDEGVEERRRRGRRGRRRIEQDFSVETCTAATEALFEELLEPDLQRS